MKYVFAFLILGSLASCTTTHQVSHTYVLTPTHIFIVDDSTCSPPKEIF